MTTDGVVSSIPPLVSFIMLAYNRPVSDQSFDYIIIGMISFSHPAMFENYFNLRIQRLRWGYGYNLTSGLRRPCTYDLS